MNKHLVNTFIHLDFRSSVSEVLQKALLGIEVANFELPLYTKDGKRREVLLNATPRRGEDGSIVGVLGVGQDITVINQQRQEAMRIADDLGRIIETANAPIFGVDTNGRVTEWNLMLAKLSEFSKIEAVGKSLVQNFITEQYRESVEHVILKALNGEQTSSFELPLVKDQVKKAILLLNAATRRGPAGEVIGVICIGQDVTQITAMKEEQQRTADDLSRLIDNANAPIFGVDPHGMVNEWNKKAADMLGYTKDEVMGKSLVDCFIQVENRQSVKQVLQNALAGVETNNFSLPLVAKFGKRYTVLLNATTRRDNRGMISGVVGVGQDITELNSTIAESKRVADDLMRLIETANAPIFGIDTLGCVNEWNAKASSLLGFSKDEAMGKSLVSNFITEEFKISVNEVLKAALDGSDTANFEFPLFTKMGERREILLNATTRRGPDNEIIGVIGVGQDITAMREITKEQERVADDLSRLIESANAPIFGVDLQGHVTEWNRKAADILGYTKDETMGKHLVNHFIQPENRDSVGKVLQRALTGEDTANYELPLLSKTSKRLTVLLNATTRRDAKGHIIGVVGVGQDITELNKLMADSKRVADDLTRLIETAHAPIFGINTEGKVTEWNHMMHNVTEYSKEEALGYNLVDKFISDEYHDSVGQVLKLALNGVETANFEFPLFTKNKERQIQILMSATPRRGPDGQIIGMIGVGQDITQLRMETRKAETTAKDLSRIIDTANAPIFGVDRNHVVTEWNQMMSTISGVSKQEALGLRLRDWLTDANVCTSIEKSLNAALVGSHTTNFELRFNRRETSSGRETSEVVLLLSATARQDSTGVITGIVSIGQNITELKAMEEKKLRFMAVVSHELRSPIHGICGLSEVMSTSEVDPKRQKQLNMIRNCSLRLLDLVTNIMDVSQMRAKSIRLTKGPCNVTQIIEETVHLLLHATDKRGKPVMKPEVRVVNRVEEAQLPVIQADTYRITQVFSNLIMNSLKFTPRGRICIYGDKQEKGCIKVSVEDTGVGIGSAHLERIFEPFEQEDDSEARTFEGIGLGLAISRDLVRRHGGEIHVKSEVGKGSTFTVELPLQMMDQKEEDEEEEEAEDVREKLRAAKVREELLGRESHRAAKPPSQASLKPPSQASLRSFPSQEEHIGSEDLVIESTKRHASDKAGSKFGELLLGNYQEGLASMRFSELTVLLIDDSSANHDVSLKTEAMRLADREPQAFLEQMKQALRPLGCRVDVIPAQEAKKILKGNRDVELIIMHASKLALSLVKYIREELKQKHWELPVMMLADRNSAPAHQAAVEAFICGTTEFMTIPFDQDEFRLRLRAILAVRMDGLKNIVLQSLPEFVAAKIMSGEKTVAEQYTKVGVLSCRLVSFTKIAEGMPSTQAVQMLNTVFDFVDNMIDSKDLLLVNADADSFMVLTGFTGSKGTVEQLVKFGLKIIFGVKRLLKKSATQLELAMGIHVGPTMAGIIGHKPHHFCFFGETVNAALALQASCDPGSIHISELAAGELSSGDLPPGASIVNRGVIKVSSNEMRTLLVLPAGQTAPRNALEAPSAAATVFSLAQPHDVVPALGAAEDSIDGRASLAADSERHVKLLQDRVQKLRTEVLSLRKELLSSQRQVVSFKAQIVSFQEESNHTWSRLLDTEEELMRAKDEHEKCSDKLMIMGVDADCSDCFK
eukprot:TRINITY_DN8800_c0_g1_i1.p1 TRINITY_DN8800_c0_g1~~TRINITY_DN8800_c0_g1_i1.p1  ORF type:complete len:1688 (+),score=411.50 TRINITY_DN8800_c0_g1_i1:35-5065(+)